MHEKRPVMIVGAGPTGLTAAMELSRFKIPVRLVDRYKEPSNTSRALAVQSRTLELFFQRGLTDEMLRLGNKGLFTTIYGNGKKLGSVDLKYIDSRFNYVLLLAQSETERILREQLARQGVNVERETEMVAFSQDEGRGAGGVRVALRKADGSLEEVEAAYLIDSEGAHSTVRHTLNVPFKGKSLQHSYALADLHLEGDVPENQLSVFLSENGLLAAFPMGNHRFRVIATEKDEVALDAPDPDLAYMHELFRRGSHIPVRFYDMVWSSRFRINSRMIGCLKAQRIFFGGDSAHVHSPAGGQGMNTGIQDMINLGWKLALVYKGVAKPKLLDTYDPERMPIIRSLVSTTETATDLFNADSSFVQNLMTHALPIALSFQAVQKKGAGIVSELRGNYRDSPLTVPHDGSGGLRSGDRAPDIRVGGHGSGDTLLSLLDPSRFTLFMVEDAPNLDELPQWAEGWNVKRISAPSELEDANTFRAALGSSRWLLVRPDGYLLWTSSQGDSAAVRQWCSTWLA